MRIALDCRAVYKGMGGIGRYAFSLLKELSALEQRNEYVCYFTKLDPPEPLALPPGFSVRRFESGMIDERFDQFLLPGLLQEDRVDLYHNPTFSVPLVKGRARTVATVHDVVFKRHPELVEPRLRGFLDKATRGTCRSADRIVTVSEFSKKELLALYPAREKQIKVIHNGVHPPPLKDGGQHEHLLNQLKISGSYALYVGSVEKKKNIDLMLLAFKSLKERGLTETLKLMLVGSQGAQGFPLGGRLKQLGLGDCVRSLGYVPEELLEALYAGALIFVYPSLYEGFGLPPLEAMARGVPTIVSRASSLPEVVGDAALKVDPQDSESLSSALRDLLEDSQLRRELSSKGRERARGFSWAKAAREHLQLYEDVLKNHESVASGV